MVFEIPGRETLTVSHVIFDYNGTLALDGAVTEVVKSLLREVSAQYATYIVTADTFGTAGTFAETSGLSCHVIHTGTDKARFVQQLGAEVAAVGNGANDALMFRRAALAIGVLGPEGIAREAMLSADLLVPSIERGLELLLQPKRLVATLRP